jgi:predicted MFS family arabinose efflux permease
MTQSARRLVPASGSWLSIVLIYLFGVQASASLSKIIPVLGDIGASFDAGPVQLGMLISLITVLPAVLASAAGSIIDRMGAHRALQLVALTGVAVNLAYLFTASVGAFMAVRVVEGLLAVGAYSAAPALMMATASDARRGRAMALWSTYSPVGASLGFALSASFAGTPGWRGGYAVHLVLFALLAAFMWMLPPAPAAPQRRPGLAALFSVWAQPGPLRLALTFAMLVVMGFGAITVFPEWFARQHRITVGQASNILAVANLVMIPGGLLAGAMLARGFRDGALFTGLVVATVMVSVPLFMPGMPAAVRLPAIAAWMLLQGALIAAIMSALPRVVADPRQGAAAAGLMSQLAAAITFVTPLIWQPLLQRELWLGFVGVAGVAAAAAWLLFPRRAR